MLAVFENCSVGVRSGRRVPRPFGAGHLPEIRRLLRLGQGGPREEDVLLPQKIVGRDERHYLERGLNVGHAPKERRPSVLESHLTYMNLAFVPLSL